jgi:hypothetical protein
MNLDFFVRVSQALRAQHPQLRTGQCAFLALETVNRPLAEELRGSDADPFYDDGRLVGFYAWLMQRVSHPSVEVEDRCR